MPRRGENIYKRKDGRWEGRFIKHRTEYGKLQYSYVYGKSYSEAKAKLKDVEAIKNRSIKRRIPQPSLYHEVLNAWLISIKSRVKE